jgi:sulfate permease, SulP family
MSTVLVAAPVRPRSWWPEASGAVADLGVLIPIAVALIVRNGLSPTAVLVPAGILYLVVAGVYRVPVAVQPLKAFGAAAIAAGSGSEVIAAGSLLMGVVFFGLGSSGLLDRLGRAFPRSVIRGVQLAVGLTLARIAHGLLLDPPGAFVATWPVLPAVLGAGLVTWCMLRWGRATALIAVAAGFAWAILTLALSRGGSLAPLVLGPTPLLRPELTSAALTQAAVLLVLPQIPLTLTNSCLAPANAARAYFPTRAHRVSPSRLAKTLGLANIGVACVSGMPLCHGAGGMSAHHAFGARSWRAPVLIGSLLTLVGILFGQVLVEVLAAFPLPILAALLLVAGLTHARLMRDLRGLPEWGIALMVGGSALFGELLLGIVLGLGLAFLHRLTGAHGSGRS